MECLYESIFLRNSLHTFPGWVRDFIQRFDLLRGSMAKYVVGVNTLKREGIQLTG